jgi:predicted hydrocarbon binding protein
MERSMIKKKISKSQTIDSRQFAIQIGQFALGEKVGEGVIVAHNRKGELGEIIQTIEETNSKVFKIFGGTKNSKDSESTFLIFFEAQKSNMPLDGLRRKLNSLDSVTHASVFGTEEFLVDTHAIWLKEMDRRSVIIADVSMGEILKSVSKAGPESIAALKWGSLKAAVRNVSWFSSSHFGRTHQPREKFSKMIDLLQSAGWGSFETKFRNNGTPEYVTVRGSFEVDALKGMSDPPGCLLLNGYLTGLATSIFNHPTKIEEKLCAGQGKSICKFYFETTKQK